MTSRPNSQSGQRQTAYGDFGMSSFNHADALDHAADMALWPTVWRENQVSKAEQDRSSQLGLPVAERVRMAVIFFGVRVV